MKFTCSGCGVEWSARRTCHCSGCHQTFSGINTFDRHRRKGKCNSPCDEGLVDVDGVWKDPEAIERARLLRGYYSNGHPTTRVDVT